MKELKPFVARLVTERIELNARIVKLESFLENPPKDVVSLNLLYIQLSIMKAYESVLTERILLYT